MILISHRGNLDGPDPFLENTKDYIIEALHRGYNCEIDVWYLNNNFYLSHDEPEEKHKIDYDWLIRPGLYIHCKNIEALNKLYKFHVFFHDKDACVFTSRREIWTYPGEILTGQSIAVMPEMASYTDEELKGALGICSDYIIKYKDWK